MKTRHVVVLTCMAVLVTLSIGYVYQASAERKSVRCQAAQQTILEEAEMIAAGGKFPGEQVTDRWKQLLEGC